MINFKFGKTKPSTKQVVVLSLLISVLIATLSQCTGISRNNLWDLLDEIQRKYLPQGILNEIILQDPDQIKRRVDRDVTESIDDVMPEYDKIIQEEDKKYQPRYIEEKNDESLCYTDECKALAPPMRLCATWLDDCPKD